VLFGRDREREAIARLVISEGFRALLLYGEPGVGKTSLLHAGVVPHLRDHGVVALVCDDMTNPIESFASAVTAATGLVPNDRELPVAFLARVVSQSLEGQLYLFIIDEVDRILATQDERIIADLGDLFSRVVTRSGGRARFMFCCCSSGVHLFGHLERRTGSLFPPTNRYELLRFQPAEAALVLDRTLALAGVAAEPQLAHSVIDAMARDGDILPADVQIAAFALRELKLTTPEQVSHIGGASELERLWITAAAAATGSERATLRLVAELAKGRTPLPYPAEWAAARSSIAPDTARHALDVLCEKGVVHAVPVAGSQENHYELAHEILMTRVREVAAPARASARTAFELLGSKASEGKRLSLREWREVNREGLSPSTPEERGVMERTKRFYYTVAGAIAAAPILFLIIVFFMMSGRFYLDVSGPSGAERVVVKKGRPGLTAFDWLPGGFGSTVADTGFSQAMMKGDSWKAISARDVAGDLDGDAFVEAALDALLPSLSSLIEYASTGNEPALDTLSKGVQGPEDLVALLEALTPISRGGAKEVDIVEQALIDPSPAVRSAALAVAQGAARRNPGAYKTTLAKQLAASDAEQRRLAFSVVRALGDEAARALYNDALAANPDASARRDLLTALAAEAQGSSPSASMAASVLANKEIEPSELEKARAILRRAFATSPAKAAGIAAALSSNAKAPPESRVFALGLMLEFTPEESYGESLEHVELARRSKADGVRAAALPVYAKFAPAEAAGHLAIMLEDKALAENLRIAMALAWGEIAKTGDAAAASALEQLLKVRRSSVRAAAAEAYGNVGRPAQDPLAKMVKVEGFNVAVGAARGLANSAMQGGSVGVATSGIGQMWKRKGRSRRAAAAVYARLGRSRAKYVFPYLQSALRSKEDTGLHTIGARGVCNALEAGYRPAQSALVRAAKDESLEVRRIVIRCVADHPKYSKTATRIASQLVADRDAEVRIEAARVLASMAEDGKVAKPVATALARLATDQSRAVRIIAVDAIAGMGADAPPEAPASLAKAFRRADVAEKLVVLRAAQAIGASDMVPLAIADRDPAVRVAAVDAAIATNTSVATSITTALTDTDSSVRRAALTRLADEKGNLDAQALDKALALAIRDADASISGLALSTFARLVAGEKVLERLSRALGSRSERVRAQAAAACKGLVDRGDPKNAVLLLEPLLDDSSHDVRVALLPVIATAYAATNSPEQLGGMLRDAEKHSMRRLAATAAFLALARTEAGREAAPAALTSVEEKGGPMARLSARLAKGLVAGSADGIEFLKVLVP